MLACCVTDYLPNSVGSAAAHFAQRRSSDTADPGALEQQRIRLHIPVKITLSSGFGAHLGWRFFSGQENLHGSPHHCNTLNGAQDVIDVCEFCEAWAIGRWTRRLKSQDTTNLLPCHFDSRPDKTPARLPSSYFRGGSAGLSACQPPPPCPEIPPLIPGSQPIADLGPVTRCLPHWHRCPTALSATSSGTFLDENCRRQRRGRLGEDPSRIRSTDTECEIKLCRDDPPCKLYRASLTWTNRNE